MNSQIDSEWRNHKNMVANTTELNTTVDQWREALAKAQKNDPGQTMQEISKSLGRGLTQTKTFVRQMIAGGHCKPGMAFRQNAVGRSIRVPVYQLVEDNNG